MKLPTLDEMIGLDKFNLTESQKHDCRSLANHRGFDAALEQAKKFSSNPPVIKSVCEHKLEDLTPYDDIYAECKCGKTIMGYK